MSYGYFGIYLLGYLKNNYEFTVTLTEAQRKALEYVALDASEWINNAATASNSMRFVLSLIISWIIDIKLVKMLWSFLFCLIRAATRSGT